MSTRVESDHSPAAAPGKAYAPSAAAVSVAANASEPRSTDADSGRRVLFLLWLVTAAFGVLWSTVSYCRWANFQYRTFDLAYYVQAIWQLIHGRSSVTVENVPLLGNHVEPIIFLFAPIFVVVRHPMMFVVLQNAALASMAPLGYLLARRFFDNRTSVLLSLALLMAPATSFVALHEFHPEALAAPLLLLLIYARTSAKLWLHWLSFFAVLACKENMALLLAAYCIVFLVIDRRRGFDALVSWYGLPLLVTAAWFPTCTQIITPVFNSGNIDYLSLYDRLGKSGGEIFWNAITKPQLVGGALSQSLTQGNLVWGLLLPFAFLPLLRPRWLLISAPVFLQHLLSWRSSEWSIYFHYAAPLLPLLWVGAVEGLTTLRSRWPAMARISVVAASLVVAACIGGQIWTGLPGTMWSDMRDYAKSSAERARKQAFIAQIPAHASVVAPLPYLSHLAMRERIYSLHYILKGLKTLSHEPYEPPPPCDCVFIDYGNDATFDVSAGFYHPVMRTVDGTVIPSSDQLLNKFLAGQHWSVKSDNELTLLRAETEFSEIAGTGAPNNWVFQLQDTMLINLIPKSSVVLGQSGVDYEFVWFFHENRQVFPWMILRLTNRAGNTWTITKGLCAPEIIAGNADEGWHLSKPAGLSPGDYEAEALFFDNTRRAMNASKRNDGSIALLTAPVQLGRITVTP